MLAERLARNEGFAVFVLGSLVPIVTTLAASILGMESVLALLFLIIALELFLANHALSALFAALIIFLRPELFVFTLLLTLFNILRKKIPLLKWFAMLAVGSVPFLLLLQQFFSTIIPHTIFAKSKVYALSLTDFFQFFSQPHCPATELLLLGALYSVIRLWQSKSSSKYLATLLSLGGTIIILAYVFKGGLLFSWYLPLFSLPLLLAVALAITACPSDKTLWITGVVVSAKSIFAALVLIYAILFSPGSQQDLREAARARTLLKLGSTLQSCYPNRTFLAPEIGALGFSYTGTIVDAVGLATPEALRHHPLAVPEQRFSGVDGSVPEAMVKELKPEIIVAVERFLPFSRKSWFTTEYLNLEQPIFQPGDPVSKEASTLWGSKAILVSLRRDLNPLCFLKIRQSD
jgi:hypothetical protein